MFPKNNGLITAESLFMFYTKIGGVNETKSNDNDNNSNNDGMVIVIMILIRIRM